MSNNDERFPKKGSQPRPNVITAGQFIAKENFVHKSCESVIVTGANNFVGAKCKNVSVFNSSGCVVFPGLTGVTIFNSSGTIVEESNTLIINGVDQSDIDGVYTPTLTNVINLTSSTVYQAQWLRQGSVVTVSGKVKIQPTITATTTKLGISLPIASDIGSDEDCGGVAFCPTVSGMGAAIYGDKNNDRAQLELLSSDTGNNTMYFTFTYRII